MTILSVTLAAVLGLVAIAALRDGEQVAGIAFLLLAVLCLIFFRTRHNKEEEAPMLIQALVTARGHCPRCGWEGKTGQSFLTPTSDNPQPSADQRAEILAEAAPWIQENHDQDRKGECPGRIIPKL